MVEGCDCGGSSGPCGRSGPSDPPGGPNPPGPLASLNPLQCPPGPPALTFDHKLRGSDVPKWDGAPDGYKLIQWMSECRAWEALGGGIPEQLGLRLAMNFEGMVRNQWLMLSWDQQVYWTASLLALQYWCLNVYLVDQFLTTQRLKYFNMQYQQDSFRNEDPLAVIHHG